MIKAVTGRAVHKWTKKFNMNRARIFWGFCAEIFPTCSCLNTYIPTPHTVPKIPWTFNCSFFWQSSNHSDTALPIWQATFRKTSIVSIVWYHRAGWTCFEHLTPFLCKYFLDILISGEAVALTTIEQESKHTGSYEIQRVIMPLTVRHKIHLYGQNGLMCRTNWFDCNCGTKKFILIQLCLKLIMKMSLYIHCQFPGLILFNKNLHFLCKTLLSTITVHTGANCWCWYNRNFDTPKGKQYPPLTGI